MRERERERVKGGRREIVMGYAKNSRKEKKEGNEERKRKGKKEEKIDEDSEKERHNQRGN